MVVRVGCCGWPVARPRYFATFELVEIQESFYNLPRLTTVEKWRAAAPSGFEFVLKAPQLITHEPTSPTYRRLRKPLSEAQKKRYGAFKPTREVRTAWGETLALGGAGLLPPPRHGRLPLHVFGPGAQGAQRPAGAAQGSLRPL